MIKRLLILTTLVLPLTFIHTSLARVLNVPSEYATIQAGIDEAINGDTVLVAPGEYAENLEITNKNILLTSSQGPDSCHIRGSIEIGPVADTICVVRGFYITHYGGTAGVPVSIEDCSPTIEANIIKFTSWGMGAGGIRMRNSDGIIRGNIISRNYSDSQGGGISAYGHPIIENNIIRDNAINTGSFSSRGGAIYVTAGTIRGNVIVYNSVSSYYGSAYGGGIYVESGPCIITNNTFLGNGAHSYNGGDDGGALSFPVEHESAETIIKNNIIFRNSPSGASAYITDSTWDGWDYNLVFDNFGLDYDGVQPGVHDVHANPLFTDGYHLLPGSPCIDAGDPTFPLDPDSTRADIGAYYFDQAVGVDEPGPTGPYHFSLAQNYPNPFNAQTVISYNLDKDATVSLLIFSITGQFIGALANKEMQGTGEHKYAWDGTDRNGKPASTGIYFYELYVDDYKESKAMILVK